MVLVPTGAVGSPGFYIGPIFGISTGPDDELLVANAGKGIVDGDTGVVLAPASEFSESGLSDVEAIAGTDDMWAITGGGPGVEDQQFLYRVDEDGNARQVADLRAFELRYNPHSLEPDSNPFDVENLGGGEALVADAGGNTLLKVDKHGNVKLVAVLPDEEVSSANAERLLGIDLPETMEAQPVATSVAIGPDGYYYVGELKGFPAPVGESRIWRIAPNARNAKCGQSPLCTVAIEGLTSIVDLQFGPNGRLYAAQIDNQTWLAVELAAFEGAPIPLAGSVQACNLTTKVCSTAVSGEPVLTSITFRESGLWGLRTASSQVQT